METLKYISFLKKWEGEVTVQNPPATLSPVGDRSHSAESQHWASKAQHGLQGQLFAECDTSIAQLSLAWGEAKT